jgi:DNA-binding protein WhiA
VAHERDLVAALRAELAAVDPSRTCDRRALAAGLAVGGVGVGGLGVEGFAGRDAVVARLTVRLNRGAPDGATAFDWSSAAEHCRTAYLRGRFLARGSLSLAGGRTHLEFVVPAAEAPILAGQLRDVGLPALWRLRRDSGVGTWKSAETVGTFLRRAGAGAALLELEARQVSRAVRGDLNRVINAESANLTRAVAAAGRQLAAIDLLEGDGRLARQSYVVRLVADARAKTPEATYGELADRLALHRSAVQRALERIERLALHDDNGIGLVAERRARRRARSGRPLEGGPRPTARCGLA